MTPASTKLTNTNGSMARVWMPGTADTSPVVTENGSSLCARSTETPRRPPWRASSNWASMTPRPTRKPAPWSWREPGVMFCSTSFSGTGPFSVVAYGGIGQKYIGFRNITAVKETFDVRIQRELQRLKACPEPVKVQRFHMGFHLIIQLFQIHGCSLLRDDRCFTARKETRKNQKLHPKRYRKSDNS